jgi:hypothetical protein
MYAVASKLKDQDEVMTLHPWLSGGATTYDSYLAEHRAYGLSRVMDRWKDHKTAKTHFFVIASKPSSDVIGGPWKDFYEAGSLAWIFLRDRKFIIRHRDTKEIDLDSTFGTDGRKFWFRGFINWEWSDQVGYYVGIEGNDHDPRIWAAFGPDAPRDALMGAFALCSVISGASFRAVTSRITECQNHSGEYRLWKANGVWFLIYNGTAPIRADTAGWPYLAHLLRYPNKSFSSVDLGLMDRLPDTEMPNYQAKSEFTELPEEGLHRKKSSHKTQSSASREAEAMWGIVFDYLQLIAKREHLREEASSANGEIAVLKREELNEIEVELKSSAYSGIEWLPGESEEKHVDRLQKLVGSRSSQTGQLSRVNKSTQTEEVEPLEIKRARERAKTAIEREIIIQQRDHPVIGEYLKKNVIPGYGTWKFVGKEDWKFTPPDSDSGKT